MLYSRCFHYDRDAPGFYGFLYGNGDLLCEPFLDLQSSAERLRNARKLREAKHELIWNIRDRNLYSRRYMSTGANTRYVAGMRWDRK